MGEHEALRSAVRTEIGGMPAYVADLPGRAQAALIFRVGQSDETLATRGLTHLVEHLALGRAAAADVPRGFVDVISTLVLVEGTPEEAARRLHDAARGFAELPLGRLEVERRVLAAEESAVSSSRAELYAVHFGARGPGLVAMKELGLRGATADSVAEHAGRWFTRDNAALVVSRPLPGLTDLPLPAGERRLVPEHPTVRRIPKSCEVELEYGSMALGAPVTAGPAAAVLRALLERRAWRLLRHERGLAYSVDCEIKHVGPGRRLLTLISDARTEDVGEATRLMVKAVRGLARGRVDAAELAGAKREIAGAARDEPFVVLVQNLGAELAYGSAPTPSEHLAAIDAVTADEVARVAHELNERLIAVMPPGGRTGMLEPRRGTHGASWVKGDRLALTDAEDAPATIVLGAEGVTVLEHDGSSATVRFAQCAAAVLEPDGALALIAEDDDLMLIDPAEIVDGTAVVARILAAVSPEVVVPAAPGQSLRPSRPPRTVAAASTGSSSSTSAGRVTFTRRD